MLADDDRVVDELVEERDLLATCCFVIVDEEEEDLVSLCDVLRVSYNQFREYMHATT